MKSKHTYRLINPYIDGSVDTLVTSRNAFNASKKIYKEISTYFTNNLERINMTLQNAETGKLYHFSVNEKLEKNGDKMKVDYKIDQLEGNLSPEIEKKLIKAVENIDKQKGGYRYDDSDSSSDSDSSDDYVRPIRNFTYFYLPYHKCCNIDIVPLDINRVFVPTFNLPINPTIVIRMDLYNYTY